MLMVTCWYCQVWPGAHCLGLPQEGLASATILSHNAVCIRYRRAGMRLVVKWVSCGLSGAGQPVILPTCFRSRIVSYGCASRPVLLFSLPTSILRHGRSTP